MVFNLKFFFKKSLNGDWARFLIINIFFCWENSKAITSFNTKNLQIDMVMNVIGGTSGR